MTPQQPTPSQPTPSQPPTKQKIPMRQPDPPFFDEKIGMRVSIGVIHDPNEEDIPTPPMQAGFQPVGFEPVKDLTNTKNQ